MATTHRHPTQPHRRQPLLVGRDREQALLRKFLDDAIDGDGSLVLVSGEAGIGKSTLVNALIQDAKARGCLVLTGGCYDLTTTPPYGPWVEITRGYPTDDNALPALPEQFRAGTGMAGIGSPSALFELVRGFLSNVRDQQPLVLVLEDLHWSDPASLELLRYLGRNCANDGILLIATYRDDELTRRHPLFQLLPVLAREADATRIELQHLSRDQMRELAIARGLSGADAYRLAAYLEQRTSGNPLFATELLRALETEGTLTVTADGASLGELDESYLPSFVLQIIERRLAPLDPETRRALEVAAVVGQEVRFDVWEAVSELDQATLDAAIEQAFATHVLEETLDHQGLRFTHALIREVLHDGVIPTRRRVWHRNAADALIASHDPDPDEVAFHLEQASDSRLVDWLIRAAERAERRQARMMAADLFDRAQSMLDRDAERAGERAWLLFQAGHLLRHSDFDRSIQLLEEAKAVALAASRPVIAHLARAHQGLSRVFANDVRRGLDDMWAGVLALEHLDSGAQAELDRLAGLVTTGLGVQGRGTLALQVANAGGQLQEAKALLEVWPESEWETSPDAYRAAGIIYAALGQPSRSRQAFNRSRELYESLGDPGRAGTDVLDTLIRVHFPYATDDVQDRHELIRTAQALWLRDTSVPMAESSERFVETLWALDHFHSGDWDRADELLSRQMPLMRSPWFDPTRVQLARHRGDVVAGWELIRSYLTEGAATEPGTRRYFGMIEKFQPLAIELALDAGDLPIAHQWLEAHDRLLDWSGAVHGQAENQLLWARYHLLDGELRAARQRATQALAHASDPRQPLLLLAVHRLLGGLDTLEGRFTEADEHLQNALDLADACQAPFERARTLLELARLRATQGQPDESRRLLAKVRAICEPLKAQPTLDQVVALEAEIEDRPVAIPFGLTPRELDVLRLVAEGLTDPEVAERLFVSPRTVSSHLTSVYTKLGVSSRTAATRLAVEQHLL